MRPLERLFAFFLAVPLVVMSASSVSAHHVDPGDIITVLPKDRIPAITDPRFGQDPQDWLPADSRVIGLIVNGDVRAYPLAILNWHEIVDDVVGGQVVAVTFCPLCGTGIVYDRAVGQDVLVFKVSGKLYKNDLVMYDTATDSLWSQLTGEGILGTYHGFLLDLVTSSTMSWQDWKGLHPETKLLDRPRDASGNFVRDYLANPYAGYEGSASVWFPRGNIDPYKVLSPKELVLGLVLGNQARAYPESVLKDEPAVNDVLGGVSILVTSSRGVMKAWDRGNATFHLSGEGRVEDERGNLFDMITGVGPSGALVEIPAVTAFWFAWYDFYPATSIYGFLDLAPRAPLREDRTLVPWLAVFVSVVAVAAGVVYWVRRRRGHRG